MRRDWGATVGIGGNEPGAGRSRSCIGGAVPRAVPLTFDALASQRVDDAGVEYDEHEEGDERAQQVLHPRVHRHELLVAPQTRRRDREERRVAFACARHLCEERVKFRWPRLFRAQRVRCITLRSRHD